MRSLGPLDHELLHGDFTLFSEAERERREAYVALVVAGRLEPPHPEWLTDVGEGVSGDAASRLATDVYNVLADSRPSEQGTLPSGGFANILKYGGDAELWTLIRIALAEASDDDYATVCEDRRFRVFKDFSDFRPRSRSTQPG